MQFLKKQYQCNMYWQNTITYTISKHMGNSSAMIERHYSKLTATMGAERLV